MTLNMILSGIKDSLTVDLSNATHKSLSLILDNPLDIEASFKRVSSDFNPRFVLIAVSKETDRNSLGKYIAYEKNSIFGICQN